MKYLFLILLSICMLSKMNAQDIDIYKKEKNDNYKLPEINQKMSYGEFELLSQNMRMKDMLYASIVPGYVHFKAQETKKGYWLLGIRSASYIAMGAVIIDSNQKYGRLLLSNASIDDQKTYKNVFYTALTLASATYLYDIIHGDYILHKKQEKIRYKYAIKPGTHPVTFQHSNSIYPSVALKIEF